MTKILIIEDSSEIRENVVEILELNGYEVIEAANGHTGLQLIEEAMPSLILCDISMPKISGYEVLRHLKGIEHTSGIPFIFLTANVEKRDRQIGYALGADGYVDKPFEVNTLLAEIARCLQV